MSQHGSSEYSIEHFHTNVPAFVAFGLRCFNQARLHSAAYGFAQPPCVFLAILFLALSTYLHIL